MSNLRVSSSIRVDYRQPYNFVSSKILRIFFDLFLWLTDSEDCDTCDDILEELETIDDDTDKHGIQFVKSKDSKLASDIGIFSFPALVYYETGVPIMYDGKWPLPFVNEPNNLCKYILCIISISSGDYSGADNENETVYVNTKGSIYKI